MTLPADSHVHSEWSWDAAAGSMERTCARAVEIGLPAVAFTEHADHTSWVVESGDFGHLTKFIADGELTPPPIDIDGYLECLQRCRDRFPSLHIISGLEMGEPHWHREQATRLLTAGQFDRVLGSLHCLPIDGRFSEPPYLYRHRPPADVLRDYLAEIPRLVQGSEAFGVLAHIDYPVRYWPGAFQIADFEDEFRYALGVLAESGRALEVNTRIGFNPEIVRWWRSEGGKAITFGSDAHTPAGLAQGFAEATAMVEAYGFRPGRHPYDFWTA
jgi:histidinol-phosphatase (PHP family)